MQLKIILFITLMAFMPVSSMAEETKIETNIDIKKIELMNIETLIEKAKEASFVDRTKIENLIKKKISQAHRVKLTKG